MSEIFYITTAYPGLVHILITSIIDIQKTPYSRLHHFICHLAARGHRVSLISIRDSWKHEGTLQNTELAAKVSLHYITVKDRSILLQKAFAYSAVGKILDKIRPETVDVHLSYNSLVISYLAAKRLARLGVQTVYDLADDLPDMIRTSPQVPAILRPIAGWAGRKMLARNLSLASHVTITAREFLRSMGISAYNYTYVPNGVDTKHFGPRKHRHKGTVVGYVGALREWVNLRPMLLAVRALKGYKIRVLVVGGEADLRQYRKFVRDNHMEHIVAFTGNVPYSEVPAHVNSMDIGTMPFRKNRVTDGTCPLKLLEYMACEKPAICSRLNETMAICGDRVLYADTKREWEKQISALYHDAILRETLGRQGRKFVQDNFSWKRICSQMEGILTSHAVSAAQ